MSALLLSLALLSPMNGLGDDLARLEMKPVELTIPGGEVRTVYRGMLRVPIVRSNPESKEIGIDVWRFPADPGVAEDQLPLFSLFGGPGWEGYEPGRINWVEEVAPYVAHADLIVVGQRGIGMSEPNTSCDAFAPSGDSDETPEAQIVEGCRNCRAHWEGQGYDLTGFNIIEAAGDVNDVRRLLGYEKLVLIGGSFGSHWGITVMRYHPEIVARALLHGIEGPDHTYDSPTGLLNALKRIAKQAEAAPELSGRLPEEGLIDTLRFVIESIEEGPFEIEVGGELVPITGDGLRELAKGYDHRVDSRRSVGGWPADVMRLYEGDFTGAARAIQADRAGGGVPTASFFQLDCGSGISAARLAKLQADPAMEIVGNPSRFYEAACSAWDADVGEAFRGPFSTRIPTVIVHGTWDVSTPFENALELVPCFDNLHFIPVEGGSHNALNECRRDVDGFDAGVLAFLFEGTTDKLPASVDLPPIRWTSTW